MASAKKDNRHKRQHWVPQGYLAAWRDPDSPPEYDGYVWCFSRDGSAAGNTIPKKLFFEKDLYTLPNEDGTRDLRVEDGLANLDGQFVKIRREKLDRHETLTDDEHLFLFAFVAAMQVRAAEQLRHWQRQWKDIVSMGEQAEEAFLAGDALPDVKVDLDQSRSFSLDDARRIAAAPLGASVLPMIGQQLRILMLMSPTILETTDDLGFITSDRPCAWWAPVEGSAGVRGVGLGNPNIEITMPLSPRQMLLLTWSQEAPQLAPASSAIVAEFNRRTVQHADEYIVVRRNRTLPEWFETS